MRKIHLIKLSLLCVALVFLLIACAKETDAPKEEEPVTPTAPAKKFTWVINGGATILASDSYFVPSFDNIVASKGTATVDIILDTLGKGTHNISPSFGITLDYNDGTNAYSGKSGAVVITENTGAFISGTFTSSLIGGGSTSTITGEFSNVPKK